MKIRRTGALRRGSRDARWRGGSRVVPLSAALALAMGACGGTQTRTVLEPAVQPEPARIDVETGSVELEQEGVVVTAQGAMLPAPRGDDLHPTFWITVRNGRDRRIVLRPSDARLVDTFGRQLSPVPLEVGEGGRTRPYALVDPEIHTYIAFHFGWPYYPVYPYRDWFVHTRFGRVRYWHYDPFWTLGVRPVWIHEIRPPPRAPSPTPDADREESVYDGAEVTYVVAFPPLDPTVRGVRLIVPGVRLAPDAGPGEALQFELLFEQVVEVLPR